MADNSSSGSDCSDDDYNPDKDLSEKGSEIESDDEIDEEPEPENRRPTTTKKRKAPSTKSKVPAVNENDDDDNVEEVDNEEAKKAKVDALWSAFLEDTGTKEDAPKSEKATTSKSDKQTAPLESSSKVPKTVKITEIFEFAGEEVRVEKEVKVDDVIDTKNGPRPATSAPSKGRASGGLGAVLGALNKKNKISTLEKSKLDWDKYKSREGIGEEIESFNRGKEGYLEKQDFLQRTDVRQFEIEKGLRGTRRSNR